MLLTSNPWKPPDYGRKMADDNAAQADCFPAQVDDNAAEADCGRAQVDENGGQVDGRQKMAD